jgi:hypothetical protein
MAFENALAVMTIRGVCDEAHHRQIDKHRIPSGEA